MKTSKKIIGGKGSFGNLFSRNCHVTIIYTHRVPGVGTQKHMMKGFAQYFLFGLSVESSTVFFFFFLERDVRISEHV